MVRKRARQMKDFNPEDVVLLLQKHLPAACVRKAKITGVLFDYWLDNKGGFDQKKAKHYEKVLTEMGRFCQGGVPKRNDLARAIRDFDMSDDWKISGLEDEVQHYLWSIGEAHKFRTLLSQIYSLHGRTPLAARSNLCSRIKRGWSDMSIDCSKKALMDGESMQDGSSKKALMDGARHPKKAGSSKKALMDGAGDPKKARLDLGAAPAAGAGAAPAARARAAPAARAGAAGAASTGGAAGAGAAGAPSTGRAAEAGQKYSNAQWKAWLELSGAVKSEVVESGAVKSQIVKSEVVGSDWTAAEWKSWLAAQRLCKNQGVSRGSEQPRKYADVVKKAKLIEAVDPGDRAANKASMVAAKVKDKPASIYLDLRPLGVAKAQEWAEQNLPLEARPSSCHANPARMSWTWWGPEGTSRISILLSQRTFYIYKPKVDLPSLTWSQFPSLDDAWAEGMRRISL